MKERLSEKQENISTQLCDIHEKLDGIEEQEDRELPIKKRINRMAFLLSTRALTQNDVNANQAMAISLLTLAYNTASDDESMALKMMNAAKRIARK